MKNSKFKKLIVLAMLGGLTGSVSVNAMEENNIIINENKNEKPLLDDTSSEDWFKLPIAYFNGYYESTENAMNNVCRVIRDGSLYMETMPKLGAISKWLTTLNNDNNLKGLIYELKNLYAGVDYLKAHSMLKGSNLQYYLEIINKMLGLRVQLLGIFEFIEDTINSLKVSKHDHFDHDKDLYHKSFKEQLNYFTDLCLSMPIYSKYKDEKLVKQDLKEINREVLQKNLIEYIENVKWLLEVNKNFEKSIWLKQSTEYILSCLNNKDYSDNLDIFIDSKIIKDVKECPKIEDIIRDLAIRMRKNREYIVGNIEILYNIYYNLDENLKQEIFPKFKELFNLVGNKIKEWSSIDNKNLENYFDNFYNTYQNLKISKIDNYDRDYLKGLFYKILDEVCVDINIVKPLEKHYNQNLK